MIYGAGAAAVAAKKAKQMKKLFAEKGAISPETALTINEVGYKSKSGLTDKSPLFQLMRLKKHIVKVDDKYYFDVEKFDNSAVRKLKSFIVGLFEDTKE
jgi:hypothetical protein